MKLDEFWEKINLSEELIFEMEIFKEKELEVKELCSLYEKDHKAFYLSVLEKENSALWFLFLFSNMALKTYEKYKETNISEEIFWNTFLDLRFWCENYEKEYGKKGLGAHDWFYRHIDLKLFRLGRLQFEEVELEEDIRGKEIELKKGTKVLAVHIPQGEPLVWDMCQESLAMAEMFFGKDQIYLCHSWLLYPGLANLLEENSNILQFSKHFSLIKTDYNEREAEKRIFGKVEQVITNYPEETILQKKAKEYMLSGKVLGNGWGILKEREAE